MLLRKELKKYLWRKNNMKFVKNEDAVSPVIGVILMVAITVILAAVIAAFVFNLGGSQVKAPTASIVASNNPDTGTVDMKISHKGGDLLKAGEWKISVVDALSAAAPNYVLAGTGSGEFAVGSQITITNITTGCPTPDPTNTCVLTSSGLTTNASILKLATGTKYDVKMVHIPSNAMLVDTVIEVR
jgi:flagellin-like protein